MTDAVRFCDELEFALGWVADGARIERTSHALAAEGRVWFVDPVDAPAAVERACRLGTPAGVLQLLDRHARDCEPLARRLGVPHLAVPFAGVPRSPFQVVPVVRIPRWREVALWWPERRTLVCADALGTVSSFRAPGERLAVHPLLRLVPPRRLARLDPLHVLTGHGEGVHGADAADAVREAVATARRRLLSAWLRAAREAVRGR